MWFSLCAHCRLPYAAGTPHDVYYNRIHRPHYPTEAKRASFWPPFGWYMSEFGLRYCRDLCFIELDTVKKRKKKLILHGLNYFIFL